MVDKLYILEDKLYMYWRINYINILEDKLYMLEDKWYKYFGINYIYMFIFIHILEGCHKDRKLSEVKSWWDCSWCQVSKAFLLLTLSHTHIHTPPHTHTHPSLSHYLLMYGSPATGYLTAFILCCFPSNAS